MRSHPPNLLWLPLGFAQFVKYFVTRLFDIFLLWTISEVHASDMLRDSCSKNVFKLNTFKVTLIYFSSLFQHLEPLVKPHMYFLNTFTQMNDQATTYLNHQICSLPSWNSLLKGNWTQFLLVSNLQKDIHSFKVCASNCKIHQKFYSMWKL